MHINSGKILKIFLKVLLWFLSSLLLILVLAIIFIRTEKGQNLIRKEAVTYLSKKLGTQVSIGRFSTDLLSHIEIQGITLNDKSKQELLHVGKIEVNFRLLALLNNTLSVSRVSIDTLNFRMARTENDSLFNFDFIIQAFAGSSSSDKESDTSAGTPMIFDVEQLAVKQLHYVMDDKFGHQFYDVKSNILSVSVEKLDLVNQLYKIRDFSTEGVTAKLDLGESESAASESSSGGQLPQISIQKISLHDNSFSINMPGSGYSSETSISDFGAEGLNLILSENLLELKQLRLDNHKSRVLIQTTQTPDVAKPSGPEPEAAASDPFIVKISSISLTDNDLQYDLGNSLSKSTSGFNQDHIHLQQLQLSLTDFSMDGTGMHGQVNQFAAKEQSGLDIQKFKTGFLYADNGIKLDGFIMKTSASEIDGNFSVSYESLASISKNPGLTGFDVSLKQLVLGSKDMMLFRSMSGNNPDVNKIMQNDIYLEGQLSGKVADITINSLKFRTDQIRLSASGKISGLPDPANLHAAINLRELSGTTKSLIRLLPAGSIPPSIAENESFDLHGKLSVNKSSYTFDLLMNSSAGNLALDGNVAQLTGADRLSYDIHAMSEGIQVDKILMDTLYGNTAFDVRAKGRGITPATAESEIQAEIPVVHLKGYDYRNLDLNASISASIANARVQIQDSAISTNLVASYSFDTLHPLIKADAHIENIDLFRLGFMPDTLSFRGDVLVDLTTVNAKHINGTVSIPHIEITKDSEVYKLDSINLEAVNVDTAQTIALRSPFLDMNLNGYYELDVLPAVAQNLLVDYITVYPPTGTVFKPAFAKLKGELRFHPVIQAFVPELTSMRTVKFGSIVNTVNKELMLAVSMPATRYGDMQIDSTIFGLHTVHDTLEYGLISTGFRNPSVTLNHSTIAGTARDGVIAWEVELFNRQDSLKYRLGGKVINDTTKFVLQLAENQLINGEKWNANSDNQTEYTVSKHIHTNLALTSGNRKLAIESAPGDIGLPLDLKLVNFPVSTLTKIIQADTALAEGTINGIASLISFSPMQFSADLKIDSLKAYNAGLGNLAVKASNEPGTGYTASVSLKGQDNDIDLNASYSEAGVINGKLEMNKFSTHTIAPFTSSIIRDLQGSVSGNVAFEGTLDKPHVQGEFNFHDIQGSYKAYNTFFRIPEGKIQLNETGLSLSNITVYDSTGNTANIGGQVHTTDYHNYNYDLNIKTDHFMALDKKSSPNQEYYGPAYFSTDLRISSTGNVLLVKGNVKVDDKSVLNVEMSSLDTAVANHTGIIVYVDSLNSSDSAVFNALQAELLKRAPSAKIGLALNIEMTKTSKLNIFLDKTGGDFMKVSGDANLTINQQPGGQMDMQGKFTIDNGEYQLTLSRVIKRKFIVQKGSSLQWNGSPTDADIDLTALYKVETTAEAILAGSQTTNKGAFKQNLPFEVYLNLKKKLLQPDISFKLDMPVKEQNAFSGIVYSRIKQINLNESELNKQVMGLLILNQFVPQDPLASGSGSMTLFDYESMARSTAGSVISSQLNSLIGSRVKSVDLSFELDSRADYTTGNKMNETDLTVNVSRSLFNDRYTISVGSTFALEGSSEHRQNTSGLAGNYSAEYKITRDGRYRIKAYRKDQYEADNSGQVIQTGVGLVLFIDFNKYREFLIKKKELKVK